MVGRKSALNGDGENSNPDWSNGSDWGGWHWDYCSL